MDYFVKYLDHPSASFYNSLFFLCVLGAAYNFKSKRWTGKPLFLVAPLVLWLLNGIWVATQFFKWYSFKVDLYIVYPALFLISLGCFGLFVVSGFREVLLRLDARAVPLERRPIEELILSIGERERLPINGMIGGGAVFVLILLCAVIGLITGAIFAAILGGALISLTLGVLIFLYYFIVNKDEEGRERISEIQNRLGELDELAKQLRTAIKDFDNALKTRMESLPPDAGETYKQANGFQHALLERIQKIRELLEIRRPEELEASQIMLGEPLNLAIDSVNSLVTSKSQSSFAAGSWEEAVNKFVSDLQSFL